MRLLLDTHIFLWFISGDRRLPDTFIENIRNTHNEVYLSVVSIWEASVGQLGKLASIHRDPFDRMLICQALEHDLTILTVDDAIRAYPVKILNT